MSWAGYSAIDADGKGIDSVFLNSDSDITFAGVGTGLDTVRTKQRGFAHENK
jgi:hypothetical protein